MEIKQYCLTEPYTKTIEKSDVVRHNGVKMTHSKGEKKYAI
jgi:hypothetical protein